MLPCLPANSALSAPALALRRIDRLGDEALTTLRGYPWPGNVRELRNKLQAARILHLETRFVRSSPDVRPREVAPRDAVVGPRDRGPACSLHEAPRQTARSAMTS
jgi:DNA-binding NtrC family response regulator